MARVAIDWKRLDVDLRHFSRCGLPIAQQARRLGIAAITIKKRRAALGLARKQSKKQMVVR